MPAQHKAADGERQGELGAGAYDPEMSDVLRKALDDERALTEEEAAQMILRAQNRWAAERGADMDIDNIPKSEILYSARAHLAWEEVAFSVMVKNPVSKQKLEKKILMPCSGHVPPGRMVAVMGPSGCGKTTLLDILANKKTKGYTGKIRLNGHERDELFERVTGYVPQTDIMPAHALVKETVAFHAMLRWPKPKILNKKALDSFVTLILSDLGLEHVMNSKIGSEHVRGISGGQRRRVSLARGLATSAQIMFCDEPTSGLSSTDAEACARQLKIFTRKFGTTMIVVIHQPKAEVAALFDDLILLTSEPGRVVYNGPMKDAMEYYSQVGFPVPPYVNPADFYLDMVSPNYENHQSEAFVDYFNEFCAAGIAEEVRNHLAKPTLTSEETIEAQFTKAQKLFGPLEGSLRGKYAASFGKQFSAVFNRQLTLKLRNRRQLAVEYLVRIAQSVIIGISFLDVAKKGSTSQLSFIFLVLQMSAIGLMQVMPVQIEQRTVMKMDLSDNLYRVEAYILASMCIELFITLTSNLFYVLICFALGGLDFGDFGDFYLWNVLLLFVFDAYFLCIAALAADSADAQLKAMPLLILFMLYNGFFVNKNDIEPWLKWLLYISPLFYAINGIAVATMSDGVQPDDPDYPNSGQFLIDVYGFEELIYGIPVMIGMTVLFRFCQALALKYLHNIAH